MRELRLQAEQLLRQKKRILSNCIRDARQELARNDQDAYLGMTEAQQLQAAGKIAIEQLQFEAGKRKQHVASAIMAHDRANDY